MKHKFLSLIVFVLLFSAGSIAQVSYTQSIQKFQADYVEHHEVVEKKDRKYFRFFTPASMYKVEAAFTRIKDTTGFLMPGSGKDARRYYRHGYIKFNLDDKVLQLTLFRSHDLMDDPTYKDYLFLPFTDMTSGEESYAGGRYIDLQLGDIRNNKVIIDFNKAYNPYCHYSDGYNCPIPPRENDLPVALKAGEKMFGRPHSL